MSHEGGTVTSQTDSDSISFGERAPGPRGWMLVTLAVLVLAAAATALALLHPSSHQQATQRVVLTPWQGFSSTRIPAEHRATYTFQLMNLGGGTATITQVGRSGPGLRLVSTSAHPERDRRPQGWLAAAPALPIRVDAHSAISVTLVYKVSGCDGLTGRAWPIPVTYRTTSGDRHTVMVDPGSGGDGGPWHRELTSGMCPR